MFSFLVNRFFVLWIGVIIYLWSSLGVLWGQNFTNADRYFSPNLDGVKDFIEIPFQIKEKNLQKWSLTIVRKEGKVFKKVMTHTSVNPKEERLTFAKFFSRIVAKDTPLKSPNSFLWEGQDNKGNLVRDGVYYFTISAVDSWGNKSKSPLIPIVVDIVSPDSDFSLETDVFSPNGDGRKEKLLIKISSKNFFSKDRWTLLVNNEKGKTLRKFTSDEPNTSVAWDGTSDKGKKVPQGSYELKIVARDLAGNSSDVKKQKVFLVRDYEKIDLEVSQSIFSPNDDGYFDNISFETYLSSLGGLEKWNLEIKDESEQIVKVFEDTSFNKVIFFDGQSGDGGILLDGNYTSQLRAWFRSGNQPNSKIVSFRVDTQAPEIDIALRNKILNPNALGEGFKNLSVTLTYPEDEVNSYQISILKQNGDPVLKKTYNNENPPKNFIWDGRNEEDKTIPGKYIYVFKARDEVKNIRSVVSDPFEVIDDTLNVEVIADSTSISPNGDGKLDKITFTFKVSEQYQNILTKGRLTIYNSEKKKVKEYNLTSFPDELTWNGLVDFDNKENSKAASLPDGVYYYDFRAQFETQEDVSLPMEKLYLDTTPIRIDLFSHEKIFSPNGDGSKDQIVFSNHYVESDLKAELDQFTVFIAKIEGDQRVVYRRKEWKGGFPEKLLWAGKDQVEEDSPEGIYQLKIETIDHAFNKKSYFSKPVTLVRNIENLDLEVTPYLLTTTPNKKLNQLIVTPKLSSTQGLKEITYFLFLTNEKKTVIDKRFDDNLITWNLLKKRKKSTDLSLDTGLYYLQAAANFESGNHPESPVKEIFVDNDYPTVKVNTQPIFFSPDDDNINDDLDVRIIAEDNYKVKKVSAHVFRLEESLRKTSAEESFRFHNQKQIPIKTWNWNFDAQKFDNQFRWNGRGNLGDLVESATDYALFVRAQDEVGLYTTTQHNFLVDILVEKLPDGRLRIILKSINFKYDSDEMLGNYEKVLDLLIRMLRKFPDYKIHIVGHTDSRGSDAYNDGLSLKRSRRVLVYLQNQGNIHKERLSSDGKGKRELLIPKEKDIDPQFTGEIKEKMIEDNYRKNRRVEFFLKKEEK